MNIFMNSLFLVGIIAFHSIAFATAVEQDCIQKSTDITQKLSCINGLTYTETTDANTPAGARQFELQFTQLVDHNDPASGVFSQRLALIHRHENEPMVLQTSGYSIFAVRETHITARFATNQLQVEHRFFANSKPQSLDWSKLDIKQSADDFHAITVAFKQIYPQRWLNTGASKGGMTSVYHRRFYPDDLDGTVADVAPLSFSTSDQRYNDFMNNVGGDTYKSCRENFKKMQIRLLQDRNEFIPQIKGQFTQLGGSDVAYEHAMIESAFYFWQYGNPDSLLQGCNALPVNQSTKDMFDFIQKIAPLSGYTDSDITEFQPYYYQAATQLGSPDNVTSHLEKLRHYRFSIDQYTPKGVAYTYSNEAMHDVDSWVRNFGDKIIFIYGEFDPWSAGEFSVSETGKDVRKYFVPKGNHGVKFVDLPIEAKTEVIATLSRWLNKAPVREQTTLFKNFKTREMLEDLELKARRRHHLP